MYEIMIQESFSAAHRLRNYGGRCEELHGHNWRVDVVVGTKQLDSTGLAMDFKELRQHTREILSSLDHAFLNELDPFQEMNPSSENIARFIFQGLEAKMAGRGISVLRVNVWESDHSCASYLGDRA
jgi:6-pyruvoyltetrahydropterin/6-carboxytetrahydropterin synthase